MVYPMNLPPYDPIRQELENCEHISGTQASTEVSKCLESRSIFN